jgi:hypothetical protein
MKNLKFEQRVKGGGRESGLEQIRMRKEMEGEGIAIYLCDSTKNDNEKPPNQLYILISCPSPLHPES